MERSPAENAKKSAPLTPRAGCPTVGGRTEAAEGAHGSSGAPRAAALCSGAGDWGDPGRICGFCFGDLFFFLGDTLNPKPETLKTEPGCVHREALTFQGRFLEALGSLDEAVASLRVGFWELLRAGPERLRQGRAWHIPYSSQGSAISGARRVRIGGSAIRQLRRGTLQRKGSFRPMRSCSHATTSSRKPQPLQDLVLVLG